MSITTYTDDINRDWSIRGNNVYLDNGQGCGTLWFETVPQARKFLYSAEICSELNGKDSGLCSVCRCHYSSFGLKYQFLQDFVCRQWKKDVVAYFLGTRFQTNGGRYDRKTIK